MFVIIFLSRSKHLLISLLQSPPAVILEPKKIKSFTVSIVALSICHEVMEPDSMISFFFFFLNVEFQDSFFTLLFHFIKKFFNSSLLFTVRLVSSSYLRLFIFLLTILIPACVSSSLAPEYTWCTLHIS